MSAKVEINSKTLASKAVILDIEGTTTSISFVKVSQCVIWFFSHKFLLFPTKHPSKASRNGLRTQWRTFSRKKSLNSGRKVKWPVTLPRIFSPKIFCSHTHIRADSKWKLFYTYGNECTSVLYRKFTAKILLNGKSLRDSFYATGLLLCVCVKMLCGWMWNGLVSNYRFLHIHTHTIALVIHTHTRCRKEPRIHGIET